MALTSSSSVGACKKSLTIYISMAFRMGGRVDFSDLYNEKLRLAPLTGCGLNMVIECR
uniref:Putative leucine-rich repeat receptor-like protein kinase At2g19210 isoform X2 n=1 Tax=Rhizophora mucronata TaxID=61149 RepID=A0A2P2MUP6_RHIMU